ncbi:MAG: M48 family metallopeptidase [Planctomycetales bacterium]|nr:M48 family metallopeptidase [Planctomycetales bacterium]
MATEFFERQSEAHRSTSWLVAMFVLAVVGIVGMVSLATYAAVASFNENSANHEAFGVEPVSPWTAPLGAGAATLVLIVGGSWLKVTQLSGGGTAVAESVGGKRIAPNTSDPLERRVLNVVEEMALASGVPVPPVFLLPQEQGINAFAAGYSPSDAVVAVTRGTAEQLSRDELQGVVAHEFSHILNGDMRLNIRLIGVLHGILLLGLLGRMLFRVAAHSGRSSSKESNGGVIVLLMIGLTLLVIGLLGTLCGNLIKAAVSRQREYLADASAVQFTRNPLGIAGALKRIGAAITGSRLQHPNAAEMSHMYFGQGVWEGFTGLMATHPPLAKRILRLDPQWDGKYPKPSSIGVGVVEVAGAAGLVGATATEGPFSVEAVESAADQVGAPTEEHRVYAAHLIRELAAEIVEAARDPYGARAVIFALLLDSEAEIRAVQMKALSAATTPDIVEMTVKLTPAISQLDTRARLPLVDMALPALRSMTRSQYLEFSKAFQDLVRADNRLGLFEWTLHRILLRHLRPQFEKVAAPRIAYYGLQRLAEPCSVLLSTLAYTSGTNKRAAQAIADAAAHLPRVAVEFLPVEQCGLAPLEAALNQLVQVAAKHRRQLVEACAAAICADEEVNIREVELLRGISDMLDCPMPPLLPGQQVKRGTQRRE